MNDPSQCQFILTNANGDYYHCPERVAYVGARFCLACEEKSRAIRDNNDRLMKENEALVNR